MVDVFEAKLRKAEDRETTLAEEFSEALMAVRSELNLYLHLYLSWS